MNKAIKQTKCPDIEFVSAYFDGELDSGSLEFAHIKECAECQKQLESYQNLSDTLKEELSAAVPDDLSFRILSGIERRNRIKAPSKFSFQLFMKVAAMFIIIGLALTLVLPKDELKTGDNDLGAKPEFLNLQNQANNNMTMLEFPNKNQNFNSNGAIDWHHFFPASTNQNKEFNFVDENSEERPAIISPVVKQVWVLKNLESGIKKFKQLANTNQIIFTKTSNGNSEINLKISKQNLVKLVRKCHNAGFKLLSPTQPQPEQNTFTGNKDDMVNYQATFTQE